MVLKQSFSSETASASLPHHQLLNRTDEEKSDILATVEVNSGVDDISYGKTLPSLSIFGTLHVRGVELQYPFWRLKDKDWKINPWLWIRYRISPVIIYQFFHVSQWVFSMVVVYTLAIPWGLGRVCRAIRDWVPDLSLPLFPSLIYCVFKLWS